MRQTCKKCLRVNLHLRNRVDESNRTEKKTQKMVRGNLNNGNHGEEKYVRESSS